jgi:CheY-like chemotaxis protein
VQQLRVSKNYRVLIVDDYPGARYRRMRLLMDAGGFDVAEESLGRDAIARLSRDHFDLLVIDVHLPDLSGLEVCQAVKADPRTAALPVLAVSAVADREPAERAARDAGAAAFIADEADADAFVAAVRDVLHGRASA